MQRHFNVNGYCDPKLHYMVDLSGRLQKVKAMVDAGEYFVINRARQYGKTTLLMALEKYLRDDYLVLSLDFQMLSFDSFEKEEKFVASFSNELLEYSNQMPERIKTELEKFVRNSDGQNSLYFLFKTLNMWCRETEKRMVLMIDEVDSASNNQVFLDFLSQLRGYYLKRRKTVTFQSVILAGVYDIKTIRMKIRPEEEHKYNSPWNIAADFLVDMSFSAEDIAGMLVEYESDHHSGMDVLQMAQRIYDYTSGYPYLVSRLCKIMDEYLPMEMENESWQERWTQAGLLEAVKILTGEVSPLFDSLTNKMKEYPELRQLIYRLLFQGQSIVFNPDDYEIRMALMFGFVKIKDGFVLIANRIFEKWRFGCPSDFGKICPLFS